MLCANHLSKRFGPRALFTGLQWQIGRGEKVGLVGDNGAGKTTLLKLLAGELTADDGHVHLSSGERLGYLPQEMPRQAAGSIEGRVASGDARIVQAMAALATATQQMAAAADASADRAMELADQLVQAQLACDQLGAASYPGRIEQALLGLGFARSQFAAPLTSLSGGWAMRVELARLLVAAPDFLLLDEPTNHLDRASLSWLASFLRGYKGSWVIVSHDHQFLDDSVSSIAALTAGELVQVRGNYAQYAAYMAAWAEEQAAAGKKIAAKAAHLQAFIARFGAKASKAKQAQSKAKALAKLTAQTPAAAKSSKRIRIRMQVATPSSQQVLTAEQVSFAYGDRVLLKDASVALSRGDRLAIVGANGAGKSTLLKLLATTLRPQSGRVTHGDKVQPFLFGQHQADALDLQLSVLATMRLCMSGRNDTEVRSLLGAFLFGADAMERQVRALSGGEKSRLALAKMVAAPANLLLLDEPTNHLDANSRQVLAEALSSYDGTLVIISHDHDLVVGLANRFVSLDGQGGLAFSFRPPPRPGHQEAASLRTQTAPVAGAPDAAGPSGGELRRSQKARQAQARALAKEVADLEARVQATEQRLAAIDQLLSQPDVFADAAASSQLLAERAALDEDVLPDLLAAWERAAAAAEAHLAEGQKSP